MTSIWLDPSSMSVVLGIVIVMFEAVLPDGATDSQVRRIRVDPVVCQNCDVVLFS